MMRWRVYLSSFINSDLSVHYVGQRNVVICDVLERQQRFLHQQSSELLKVVGAVKALTSETFERTDSVYVSPFLQRVFEGQRLDPETKKVIRELETDKRILGTEFYLDKADYKGILCRRTIIEEQVVRQFVVPSELVGDVMAIADGGHRGVTKTMTKILERLCWKGVRADVEEYIKTCRPCQLAKAQERLFQKEYKTRIVSNVFEVLSVDVLELSTSSYSFNHLLVVMDDFSRFTLIIPIKTQSGIEIAAVLYERVRWVLFSIPTEVSISYTKERDKNLLIFCLCQFVKYQRQCTSLEQ